jgi:hypothetical protein
MFAPLLRRRIYFKTFRDCKLLWSDYKAFRLLSTAPLTGIAFNEKHCLQHNYRLSVLSVAAFLGGFYIYCWRLILEACL